MKVDLTLRHSDLARHQGPAADHFAQLSQRASTVIGRIKEWLAAEWHPLSEEEAFLAQSQNLADLERRMLSLQNPNTRQSFW